MLKGTMQQSQLLISGLLRHAATAHGDREIVSRLIAEPVWRYDWRQCAERTERVAGALGAIGIKSGDRVTSLAWNTHRHVELMYAVPSMGGVLHTANPRLARDQLVYSIVHAGSRALFFDSNLADLVDALRPELPMIEYFVQLTDGGCHRPKDAIAYEDFIASQGSGYDWPSFDENAGAILCYTSGTMGLPKGVLYSHRSIVLHALASGLSGAFDLSAFDCVMPSSSLYHANGWGLPFAAAVNGCKLVLPADKLDGASLHNIITAESVTVSAGVPTVWTMYLAHLDAIDEQAKSLRRVVIGGSALPPTMASAMEKRGVTAVQALGMTETSPLIVVSSATPRLLQEGADEVARCLSTRQGRAIYGVELRIKSEDGDDLPRDGKSAGALLLRGPWVVESYYPDIPAVDADGWFDTGDIASIDPAGFLRITDRSKDLIKSGGEWISSIDLENAAAGYAGIQVAAVIGVYHPHWEERPLLVLQPHTGAAIDLADMRSYLAERVPRWWMPDAIIIGEVPLTATGKIDKKVLRQRFRDHLKEDGTQS